MNVFNFPGCCTANIIAGFGQTKTAEYGIRPLNNDKVDLQHLKNAIERRKQQAIDNGLAVLVATVNNQQKVGIKALLECGFTLSPPMYKNNHPETQLILAYCPLGKVGKLSTINLNPPARDSKGRFVKKEAE